MGVGVITGVLVWSSFKPKYKPGEIQGDINGDGIVDLDDAAAVHDIILGEGDYTDEQIAAADVNGDGIVDMGDVTAIMMIIAGG
jgi:hypothetical protein